MGTRAESLPEPRSVQDLQVDGAKTSDNSTSKAAELWDFEGVWLEEDKYPRPWCWDENMDDFAQRIAEFWESKRQDPQEKKMLEMCQLLEI
jgi:hypothetical protein